MKKTIVIIFMVLALLMTSAVPVLALGNSFIFSAGWFDAVINQTVVDANLYNGTYENYKVIDNQYTYVENYFLRFDDNTVAGGLYNPLPFVYARYGYENDESRPRNGSTWISFTSPFNVKVAPNETIKFQIVMMCLDDVSSNDYNLSGTVRLNFDGGGYTSLTGSSLNKSYYPTSDIVQFNFNTSGTLSSITSKYKGETVLFDCSWTNTTNLDYVISSVTSSYSTNYTPNKIPITGYAYGFLAENNDNVVTLPDYVESYLSDISNNVIKQNSLTQDILTEIDALQIQLQQLIEAQSSAGSTTNNYYETITNMSPEEREKLDEITEKIEEAQEELEIITQSYDNVGDYELSKEQINDLGEEITGYLNSAIEDDTFKAYADLLFNSTAMLVPLLIFVFSLATVSYILFGKRG